MKTHLLLFLLFLGFSSFGQLTMTPNEVVINTDESVLDKKVDLIVKNEGTEAVEVWFNAQVGDAPGRWDFQICDCNLCYQVGTLKPPMSKSCTIEPGEETTFMIHLLPNGEQGEGSINMQLLTDYDDVSSSALDVQIPVTVMGVSSTENEAIESNLGLYPNPTYDGFNISNDENVTQIVIFNILGKQIKTASHIPGKTHNINNLDRGYYLVRIVDKYKNDKVLRLTKK